MSNPAETTTQFTLNQLYLMRPIIRDDCDAYKNHVASAVESGKFEYAKELVEKLREKQDIYKSINKAIHALTGHYA